jgi:hypothetical protein
MFGYGLHEEKVFCEQQRRDHIRKNPGQQTIGLRMHPWSRDPKKHCFF